MPPVNAASDEAAVAGQAALQSAIERLRAATEETAANWRRAQVRARALRRRAANVRSQRAANRGPLPRLSSREHQVLAMVSVGLTSKDISLQLGVSINTIAYHLANVYRKLGVHSRVEAANAYFGRVSRG